MGEMFGKNANGNLNEDARFDVIVLGVGGMGSAACYHLAKRGVRVLGLEQFSLTHDRGSSHGETRIIRKAYFEDPSYVPLLERAYQLWGELEAEAQERLFERTGLVLFGKPEESVVYRGTHESAKKYSIPMETLLISEAASKFPMFRAKAGESALYEPSGGFVLAEASVAAHARLARAHGALILENQTVLDYKSDDEGVVVRTREQVFRAEKLVITGGAWTKMLLADLGLPLRLKRMILYWFKASPEYALENGTPCFFFQDGEELTYGFPMRDGWAIKIASHNRGAWVEAPQDKFLLAPPADELTAMRKVLNERMPGVTGELVKFATCLYTMTPDENFVIDTHPVDSRIVFAGGFSGHGFKFAPVIGEILADLVQSGRTQHPIEFLHIR